VENLAYGLPSVTRPGGSSTDQTQVRRMRPWLSLDLWLVSVAQSDDHLFWVSFPHSPDLTAGYLVFTEQSPHGISRAIQHLGGFFDISHHQSLSNPKIIFFGRLNKFCGAAWYSIDFATGFVSRLSP
jgi:hypothetical protein